MATNHWRTSSAIRPEMKHSGACYDATTPAAGPHLCRETGYLRPTRPIVLEKKLLRPLGPCAHRRRIPTSHTINDLSWVDVRKKVWKEK